MRLHTSCILAAAIALNAAWADAPRFDRIFGSHMVLPHGKNIPISALFIYLKHIFIKYPIPATGINNITINTISFFLSLKTFLLKLKINLQITIILISSQI